MVSVYDRGASSFSVGAVLRRSFSTFFKHPFVFMGLSFTAELLPLAVMFLTANPRTTYRPSGIDFVFVLMIQSAIACAVYETLRGNRARFGQSLSRGLARLAALLGACLCYGIFFACLRFVTSVLVTALLGREGVGSVIRLAILILISAVLWCKWSLAIPACTVERLGPVDSLSRSSELTKECRLKLAGTYALCIIPMWIIITAGTSGVGFFAAAIKRNIGPASFAYFVPIAVRFVFSIAMAFFHITTAVNYYGLREAKEGISIEHLASAFD